MCGDKDRRLDDSPATIGCTCADLLDARRLLDDAPTALEFFHALLDMYPEFAQPGRAVERHHHAVAQLTSLSCDVTAGAAMTPVPPHDPAAVLNEVLSEVVDLVLAVRQARHAVREGQELDTDLHRLFTSGRNWSELLVDADTALGVSALAYMPTPTARRAPSLGAAHLTDDEIRRGVAERLDRLAEHVRAVLSQQEDDRARQVLAQREVAGASGRAHHALNKVM